MISPTVPIAMGLKLWALSVSLKNHIAFLQNQNTAFFGSRVISAKICVIIYDILR